MWKILFDKNSIFEVQKQRVFDWKPFDLPSLVLICGQICHLIDVDVYAIWCVASIFVIMYYYFILKIRYIRKISNHTITLDPDTFVRTLPPRPWAARSPLVTSGASGSSCGRRTCRSPQHDRGRADRPGIACAQAMSLHAWPGLGVSVGQHPIGGFQKCATTN